MLISTAPRCVPSPRSAIRLFVPPQAADPADKPRDRIWELADTLHCSIVGTCLTNAEARAILAKSAA